MNAFIAQFAVGDVDKGGADEFARKLLETWRSSRGMLCDDMQMLFSNLVLFDGVPTPNDTPDILFCGTDSLATKILGSGWADGPDKARLNLDATYRRLVGESYRMAAAETKPVFDMVSTPLRSGDPESRQPATLSTAYSAACDTFWRTISGLLLLRSPRSQAGAGSIIS